MGAFQFWGRARAGFDTRGARCYSATMLASPLLHGLSGFWDEALLVVEGIVVVVLVIAFIRGRRKPKPPADSPADNTQRPA